MLMYMQMGFHKVLIDSVLVNVSCRTPSSQLCV